MGYGSHISSVSNYCSVIQICCICLPLSVMINSLFSLESLWHTVRDQVHACIACGWALKFLYDFMTSFSNCFYYSFWHPGSQNLLFLVPLYSVDALLLILWMRNKWLLLELFLLLPSEKLQDLGLSFSQRAKKVSFSLPSLLHHSCRWIRLLDQVDEDGDFPPFPSSYNFSCWRESPSWEFQVSSWQPLQPLPFLSCPCPAANQPLLD